MFPILQNITKHSVCTLPPFLGSRKPIFTSQPEPSLSTFAGDKPNADSSSPVERPLYLIPLPMTDWRFPFTRASTTFPPASSTFGTISSVRSANAEIACRNDSGIWMVALATGNHLRKALAVHISPTYVLNTDDSIPLPAAHYT